MAKTVTKHTRASPVVGKAIRCPKCKKMSHVWHFGWSALVCQHCKAEVPKLEWELLA